MSWTRKETLDRFEWLLINAKVLMKRFSEEKQVYYSDKEGEEVTAEELAISTEIIRRMGYVMDR